MPMIKQANKCYMYILRSYYGFVNFKSLISCLLMVLNLSVMLLKTSQCNGAGHSLFTCTFGYKSFTSQIKVLAANFSIRPLYIIAKDSGFCYFL